MATSFFGGPFFGGEFFSQSGEAATTWGGGRGGINPWPGRSERSWDKWWKKEHLRRLQRQKESVEKKVQKLEKRVKKTRDDLQAARTLQLIRELIVELEKIQLALTREQARLDDLEMQEVALMWAAWNDE